MPSLDQVVDLLHSYRYFLLLPISVVEGPIVTIIAGFLSSTGAMNFYLAYLVVVMGDLIGDSIIYYFGHRSGRSGVPKWLRFLGITERRVALLKEKFTDNPKKIFSVGKVTHGAGSAVIFASGIAQYPYKKFIAYNIPLTLMKSGVLIFIGFYFGKAYEHISEYFDYGALVFGIVLLIIYILFLRNTDKE